MADEGRFSKLGAGAGELDVAWQDRLEDAKALLAECRNASAIACGLYALEILLKVRICRILKLNQLPRVFEIHDIKGLITMSGLGAYFEDPIFQQSQLGQNWAAVLDQSVKLNDLRYKPDADWSNAAATLFLQQLLDRPDGVFPWIQSQA